MIQEIITNLGSLNPFAKIVKGVDMKRKIAIGILTIKGKEHIKKTNLTRHHMMTTIKIITYVIVTKIPMRTMKIPSWPSLHLTTLPLQCGFLIQVLHVTLPQELNGSKTISP